MSANQIPENKSDDEEEISDYQEKEGNAGRKRLTWTNELHLEFMYAVDTIGVTRATPARILQFFGGKGLEKKQIASHLQKYRDHMRDKQRDTNRKILQRAGVNMHEKPSIFDSGPKEMIARHKAELRKYKNLCIPNFHVQEGDNSQAPPQVYHHQKKRKQDDTQKSIKLSVEITIRENSSVLDSMPEGVMNGHLSETQMLYNDHSEAVRVSPTNAAGTQVEMYCHQERDKSSDGHKRISQLIEDNILEKPLVFGIHSEDVIKRESVKMWEQDSEPIQNVNVPRDIMSENQQEVVSNRRMLVQLKSENSSATGNSLTHGYSDQNVTKNTRNLPNPMLDDSVQENLWTGQDTEVKEHIPPQNLSHRNNDVPSQYHNGMKPDADIQNMKIPSSSVDANEYPGLRGNDNRQMMSENAANNEICIASDANEDYDLKLLEHPPRDTMWDILRDNEREKQSTSQ